MTSNLKETTFNLDHETLISKRNNANLPRNFGVRLMQKIFSEEHLMNKNWNVSGNCAKGYDEKKKGLEPMKIEFIKAQVEAQVNGSRDIKDALWKDIKAAMSKKLNMLRK